MPRLVSPLVALVLFIGLGFVTRPLFRQWLETKIQEGEAAAAKERANWKPVETNFSGLKFDPAQLTPQIDLSRTPQSTTPRQGQLHGLR
jgi:hypothetical protein